MSDDPAPRPVRHLTSLRHLDRFAVDRIVDRALLHADGRAERGGLVGRAVGVYFALTSTRTRTAFTVAAHRLGANVIPYGPGDLQLNTGETLADTARVLSTMLDALVVRSGGHSDELQRVSELSGLPIVNAMTDDEHPTQALADLVTIRQVRGSLADLSILYLGEGNNTAVALCRAVALHPGAHLHLRTPPGYGVAPALLCTGHDGRGRVTQQHDLLDLPDTVDIVYTTRWRTTGTRKADPGWRAGFEPFRVDRGLLDRYPGAVFMHDLPAHRGEEVTAEVLDGPHSVAFRQAENKLWSAVAALEWTVAASTISST